MRLIKREKARAEAAEARLAEAERDTRIAQELTDAAINDYNDALARVATLTETGEALHKAWRNAVRCDLTLGPLDDEKLWDALDAALHPKEKTDGTLDGLSLA